MQSIINERFRVCVTQTGTDDATNRTNDQDDSTEGCGKQYGVVVLDRFENFKNSCMKGVQQQSIVFRLVGVWQLVLTLFKNKSGQTLLVLSIRSLYK